MKMTRKLIPALAMLLVSAIMLSTASFAWFASSTTVEANGMSVKAQTAAKFIQISNAENGTFASAAAAPSASASKSVDLVHAEIADDGKAVTWYTGVSTDPDDIGTTNSTSFELDEDGGSYALVNTFWVKMSSGSTVDLNNLTIQSIKVITNNGAFTGDNLNKALRVLVVGENGSQLWTNESGDASGNMAKASGNDFIIDVVTKTAESFKVYVFYDGESSVATTNKAVDLAGVSVAITFSATEPTS